MREKMHRTLIRIPVGRSMNDLTGKRFGMLTAEYPQRYVAPSGRKFVFWHCKCDCGRETDVVAASLMHGTTKSCGCMQDQWNKQAHTKELVVGTRHGKMVFLGGEKDQNGVPMILCQCDCGTKKWVRRKDFLSGKIISCGCQARETRKSKMHLEGQMFGTLKVIRRDSNTEQWICQCVNCGRICKATAEQLKKGKKASCGCMQYNAIKQYTAQKKERKKESVLGKTVMTESGVPLTVVSYDGFDKCLVRFADGTEKNPTRIKHLEDITHPALNTNPKQYDEEGKPLKFCGFDIIRGTHGCQFRMEDGTPIYRARCSVCGKEDLLSPMQMMEHAKSHGWKPQKIQKKSEKK